MHKFYVLLISILLGNCLFAQSESTYNYQQEFEAAYNEFPIIPKGILEAVSFAQTRFTHYDGSQLESCIGIPKVYGVMGLTLDGADYFHENLNYIASLTSFSVEEIKISPAKNIMAYAMAFAQLMQWNNITSENFSGIDLVLKALSEIPMDDNPVNDFALSTFTYQIFSFLNDEENAALYNFPAYHIQLDEIYGEDNLNVLQSKKITVEAQGVEGEDGAVFEVQEKSLEYGPALWTPAPSCNYSSRNGTAVSAVTVHTIQGSYAGAISWAQNCSSNVSYHYVARSSDGQITQMVYEADKGWHVGSANPYTIGIEHEGYVDNPAWYTEAMYIGSADLVRDITESGYGINPLRTFQGPATAGGNVLGGCTKIKGHQHYPNQTHTDPGINWDWEHYYQLINNAPAVQSLTASSGTIYDSGGAGGNYSDDERELYLIEPAGVVEITISFAAFSLEDDWDYLYVYDGNSTNDPLLGVFTGSTNPGNITSTGPAMLIEFRSDCATDDLGYEINWTSVPGPAPGDVIAPTSTVSGGNGWKTSDFNSNFTDADNVGGSGVNYQLYQVIDFDGTDWGANPDRGFFGDNFDNSIAPYWTISEGNWTIVSNAIQQDDEANSNTNIYADLNQDDYDQYLYHWTAKINGTGGNRRAGFHFMCDDPSLPNRGNSYFVWFRTDDNKIQIYKVVNDVFSLEADIPYTLNNNQWYDFKTVYTKSTGKIEVWVDNSLEASWTDPSPYTSGNSISLRSGNCTYDVTELKVYHDRSVSETVLVGPAGDIRFQNTNPLTPSGKVKSIVIDSSFNVSTIGSQMINVDWTAPDDLSFINDGTGADINTTTNNTSLSANWSSTQDPHSDIARYWYAIGTSIGANDLVDWTDNWFDTTVTHTGLSLTNGTTYYFSVRAENGAGLISNEIYSDGQTVQAPTGTPTASFTSTNSYICSNDSVQMLNSSTEATSYYWEVPGATPATSTDVNPWFQFPTTGFYDVTLTATGPGGVDTEIQTIQVNVEAAPMADFSPSATVVDISNAFVSFSNNSANANGYYWDFGDGTISSDAQPWHEYNQTGIYTVMLIAINGNCDNDTSFVTIEVVDDLGLNDANDMQLSLYPNPAENFMFIEGGEAGTTAIVKIMDASGRIVQQNQIQFGDQKTEINFNQKYAAGIYILMIDYEGEVFLNRFIIK